jgi:hypothetical protein
MHLFAVRGNSKNMKTANTGGRVLGSESVPRRPSKPKPGEQVHISFYEDGALVLEVDQAAEELTRDDEHGRKFTRTDAIRSLIRAGLAARKRGK